MDTSENNQESQAGGLNSQTSSQSIPDVSQSPRSSSSSFFRFFLGEPTPLLDTVDDYRRDKLYWFPCIAGLIGLLIGMSLLYLSFSLTTDDTSSHSPVAQLFWGLMPYQLFTFGFCMLAMLPMILRDGFRKSLDLVTPAPPCKTLAITVLKLLLMLYPSVLLVNHFSELLCIKLGIQMNEQLVSEVGKNAGQLYWICAAVCTVVLAPVTGEIMLRLVLNRAIRSIMPLWATLLSTLAFTFMHSGTPQYWPALFIVGLFLIRARRVMGLQCAILLHSTYNLLAFLFILLWN